jgi:alpha/beta superfamily hydrolase
MESNKDSEKLIFLGQQLAQRGILTLRFDFSYVGESSGKFKERVCLKHSPMWGES